MKIKKSKNGFIIAGIFVALALAALFSHLYSAQTNPGDSGESGIVLLPFSAPWIFMIPQSVVYSEFWAHWVYVSYLVFVTINSFILYALTGGIRWKR